MPKSYRGSVIIILLFTILIILGILSVFIYLNFKSKSTAPGQSQKTKTASSPALSSSPAATQSPVQDQTQNSSGQTTTVKIYLIALGDNGASGEQIGCGDSVIAVTREVPQTQAVLRAALNELLNLKSKNYGESGLVNSLYQSNLKLDDVSITGGKATVKLSGNLTLAGVCDNPRVGAQLHSTVLQFPTVKESEIFLNGKPLSDILSGKGQ